MNPPLLTPLVTRFAPSPTGYVHLGHAFAALMASESACAVPGGRFLLRIEDLDATRCREPFVAALMEDLAWLGLRWELPVVRQSQRLDAYAAALAQLQARGLLYPCFCTRREIAAEIALSAAAPHGAQGAIYPGTCRGLQAVRAQQRIAAGEPYALRLDVAKAAAMTGPLSFMEGGRGPGGETGTQAVEPLRAGDVVLARKDMPASYHLAVVVDDAWQGVNQVTRADDLFAATHVQRLLQALLGLPAPRYGHHRLLLDEQGRKLSKRDGAPALRALREQGSSPQQLRQRLGMEHGPHRLTPAGG